MNDTELIKNCPAWADESCAVMSIRAYAAVLIAQGMCGDYQQAEVVALKAVEIADAVLREIDRSEKASGNHFLEREKDNG